MARATKRSTRSARSGRSARHRRAFTLVELLVTISVVAVLVGIMLPALGRARSAAHTVECLSNLRQLGVSWLVYADDHDGQPMPAALPASASPEPVYWWGRADYETETIDYSRSPLAGYFVSPPGEAGPLQCGAQPWGSYRAQPAEFDAPTSTYGYNGYCFSPTLTGYTALRNLPRSRHTLPLYRVERPTEVLVFADTMIRFGNELRNTHLLDPPQLFGSRGWTINRSPTTSFRHTGSGNSRSASAVAGATNALRADGSARSHAPEPGWVIDPEFRLGSLGTEARGPYVPDADRWAW